VSVDRQLADAASTNGRNEVDCGRSAVIANPFECVIADLDIHATPVVKVFEQ